MNTVWMIGLVLYVAASIGAAVIIYGCCIVAGRSPQSSPPDEQWGQPAPVGERA